MRPRCQRQRQQVRWRAGRWQPGIWREGGGAQLLLETLLGVGFLMPGSAWHGRPHLRGPFSLCLNRCFSNLLWPPTPQTGEHTSEMQEAVGGVGDALGEGGGGNGALPHDASGQQQQQPALSLTRPTRRGRGGFELASSPPASTSPIYRANSLVSHTAAMPFGGGRQQQAGARRGAETPASAPPVGGAQGVLGSSPPTSRGEVRLWLCRADGDAADEPALRLFMLLLACDLFPRCPTLLRAVLGSGAAATAAAAWRLLSWPAAHQRPAAQPLPRPCGA